MYNINAVREASYFDGDIWSNIYFITLVSLESGDLIYSASPEIFQSAMGPETGDYGNFCNK